MVMCICGKIGSWPLPTRYKHPHIGPGALRPLLKSGIFEEVDGPQGGEETEVRGKCIKSRAKIGT